MSLIMANPRPSPFPTPPPHHFTINSTSRRMPPPVQLGRSPSTTSISTSKTSNLCLSSSIASSSASMIPFPSTGEGSGSGSSSSSNSVANLMSSPNHTGSSSSSKDTSSSAGKVFAKPSKEWVLPERAKPGRKASTEEPESRRQSQNRLSQRAHRARRTDYIQTLEERLRQYEADEIHSNVRLQEVARALKADNGKMKNEIKTLRSTLAAHQAEKDSWAAEKKELSNTITALKIEMELLRKQTKKEFVTRFPSISKWENNEASGQVVVMDTINPRLSPSLLQSRTPIGLDSSGLAEFGLSSVPVIHSVSSSSSRPQVPSPPPLQSTSRQVIACPICPDPDPDCPCQQRPASNITQQPFSSLNSTLSAASGCGLCDSPEECLCQTIGTDDMDNELVSLGTSSQSQFHGLNNDHSHDHDNQDHVHDSTRIEAKESLSSPTIETSCGLCTSASFCACKVGSTEKDNFTSPSLLSRSSTIVTGQNSRKQSSSISIQTDKAVQSLSIQVAAVNKSVPLRLRKRATQKGKSSVWSLDNVATNQQQEAVCTGDPSNCDACRDDKFGQEFCGHLFKSTSAPSSLIETNPISPPLSELSPPVPPAPLQMTCCGAPELCGHKNGGCSGEIIGLNGNPSVILQNSDTVVSSSKALGEKDTMLPHEAWRTLKAHPNHNLTPLSILADVVARRTKCLGPRVELSPEPSSPMVRSSSASILVPNIANIASSLAHPSGSASGVKRRMEVETSAVRDALRLLDESAPISSTVPKFEDKVPSKKMRLD